MTFDEYIANPTGKGSAVMSYRKMYEDLYNDKWEKIMVRENGRIDYKLYYNSNKKEYYCYMKMPDETLKDFYYDVVIKLTTKDPEATTLRDAEVQFFSNDPSFNYTFAYAFHKKHLTIPELEKKMSKIALTTPAKVKNPNSDIGYVKELCFAYIVMNSKGFFHTVKYRGEGEIYNSTLLASNIMQTEQKLLEREQAGADDREARKIAKQNERAKSKLNSVNMNDIKAPGVPKHVGKVGRVHTVNTIKHKPVNKMKIGSSIRRKK